MNPPDISTAKNAGLRGSMAAMISAALARQIAIQTNTGIVRVQDGQTVFIDADTLRREEEQASTSHRS